MSLYLQYRPKTIDELDLTGVRKQLNEIVESGQMSHAYLLTGPRGAGKTSTARIMARIINCEKNRKKLGEPCNECRECKSILEGRAVDVIEIDAASNRGIDDVRDLREKIRLAPAELSKKVYIIDEVHMMTTDAFNALLKTLEEPPAHSIFILATTEAHKVPETIASRCVRIAFTKATVEEMKRSLSRVVEGEKAQVADGALTLLASSVDGSFRDGVKILEQAIAGKKAVGVKEIEELLYGASGWKVSELAQALSEKEMNKALKLLSLATQKGVDLSYLLVQLMKELREKVSQGKFELIELIYSLDSVARKLSTSPVPEILLEITIIKWCEKAENQNTRIIKKSAELESQKNDEQNVGKNGKENTVNGDGKNIWSQMLTQLNGDSVSMGALLAKARPGLMQGDIFTIEVDYEFHREQIMQSKFRDKIEQLVSSVTGIPMRVVCVVGQNHKLKIEPENDIVHEAEAIFIN